MRNRVLALRAGASAAAAAGVGCTYRAGDTCRPARTCPVAEIYLLVNTCLSAGTYLAVGTCLPDGGAETGPSVGGTVPAAEDVGAPAAG